MEVERVSESHADQGDAAGELVQRIQLGDREAESELVDKYYRSLQFILSRRCKDTELAADLAQDAFIVVISKARKGEIRNPSAIASFIRQIGINLMIAHFRKESRRATEAMGDLSNDFADKKSSVIEHAQSIQELKLVDQVISEMRVQRDREILLYYYGSHETKQSLCNRYKLTSAHFDRVLFRARSRLRELINQRVGRDVIN